MRTGAPTVTALEQKLLTDCCGCSRWRFCGHRLQPLLKKKKKKLLAKNLQLYRIFSKTGSRVRSLDLWAGQYGKIFISQDFFKHTSFTVFFFSSQDCSYTHYLMRIEFMPEKERRQQYRRWYSQPYLMLLLLSSPLLLTPSTYSQLNSALLVTCITTCKRYAFGFTSDLLKPINF